ncbi:hypothetical protein AGMMS50268_37410 [Spirochaetia bacterium]|nr:hypothetical protein AGMMS50268_37410 [Spirochaetia bacterium]
MADNGNGEAAEINGEREPSDLKKAGIVAKLETMAVPMDIREFSRNEYNRLFPMGTVQTPIGEVKIGANQFDKLSKKDNGSRQMLIGAMRQTLSDPIVIIKEQEDGREAHVYIKSFKKEGKPGLDTVMTVVVDIDNKKIAISTYKRRKREVGKKIKMAVVIVYVKDEGGDPTNRR